MKTSMRPSHYEVLGASEDASSVELKAAYRARVKELHPDSGGSDEAFEALQVAWSVIGYPDKRREYDSWLADTAPVSGGSRLAVQQRFEERELEAERRAWDVRREEARKAAAVAAAARAAAAEAEHAARVEHTDVHRHLTMGAAGLAVIVSLLGLWRRPSATEVEVLGASIAVPPVTTGVVVLQMALAAVVVVGSILARPAVDADQRHGLAMVTGSSRFRVVMGVMAVLLTVWVLVPFVLRAL